MQLFEKLKKTLRRGFRAIINLRLGKCWKLFLATLNIFKIVLGLVRTVKMGKNLNLAAKVEKSIFLFFLSTNSPFCFDFKRDIVFLISKHLKSPCIIGLIPVFDSILTGWRSGQKL